MQQHTLRCLRAASVRFASLGALGHCRAQTILRASTAVGLATSPLCAPESTNTSFALGTAHDLSAPRSAEVAAVSGFVPPDLLAIDFGGRVRSASESLREDAERLIAAPLSRVSDFIDNRVSTPQGRCVLALMAANICVYGMWKVLPSAWMTRHFASSLEAMRKGRVWTAVTSSFSQYVR